MELKRYWHDRHELEYEGVQITPENMKDVAEHFHLEYVEEFMDEEGGVESALFRSGNANAIHVGDFVVQSVKTKLQAYAVLASEFSWFFTEIKEHPFVPQIMSSTEENYPSPCVFCGNERYEVPYHRDLVPGETLTLPDGGTLKLKAT